MGKTGQKGKRLGILPETGGIKITQDSREHFLYPHLELLWTGMQSE